MRFFKNAMEFFSEMSPITLGVWGLGALIAAPILSTGFRSLAVAAVRGGLEITEQARNASTRARTQWEQVVNEARQQPGPSWGHTETATLGASLGGAIGAGLGSTAGPVGAAAGGGLGAGVGTAVAEGMEDDDNPAKQDDDNQ